ncbi:MAG: PaaI family thioesterase [Proteobacteria bacterium]|nr:PaaI family thioesterase [Pseudomonadota bacterium]
MIKNKDFREKTEKLFSDANFIKELGIKVKNIDAGLCETELVIEDKHRQQHNFIHAGVIATMADHTAGAAGTTLIKEKEEILTIEFKINFIRPAEGEKLRCISKVIKAGRLITVAESEVYSINGGREKLVSKAMVTLTPVEME